MTVSDNYITASTSIQRNYVNEGQNSTGEMSHIIFYTELKLIDTVALQHVQ